MATSSDIKKVIINILSCSKTKLSKANKCTLMRLLEDLDGNDNKRESKKITEQEWYKVLKDIASVLGSIMLHSTNIHYEPG